MPGMNGISKIVVVPNSKINKSVAAFEGDGDTVYVLLADFVVFRFIIM